MSKASALLTVVALSAVLVAGCAGRVRIAELRDQPGKYSDKTVSVNGVVTTSFGVPAVFQLYQIDDGSGQIYVLSRSGRSSPTKGSRVNVKGRVQEFGTFGGQAVGLHIQEQDRNFD